MSSVPAVGPTAVTGLEPTSMASPPPAAYLAGTLDTVAGTLSMPTDDVRAALRQGSSVTDLAAQRGVRRSTLVGAIQQRAQELRAAQGKAPLDQAVLDQGVDRAVDRRRGVAPPAATAQAPSRPFPGSGGGSVDVFA